MGVGTREKLFETHAEALLQIDYERLVTFIYLLLPFSFLLGTLQ